MAGYEVTIGMSQGTVVQLQENGYALLVLRAVRAAGGGKPLVWVRTTGYSLQTVVSWTDRYQAYTSRSEIVPGGQVVVGSAYDIRPDQVLVVESPAGTGTVRNEGIAGAVSVLNQTTTQFASGICQADGGAPVCALPLFGKNLIAVSPTEKVLLTLSAQPARTGTVFERSYAPSILVDLAGATARAVEYDVNGGWSWGNGVWAEELPALTDLVPILVEPSAELRLARTRMLAAAT